MKTKYRLSQFQWLVVGFFLLLGVLSFANKDVYIEEQELYYPNGMFVSYIKPGDYSLDISYANSPAGNHIVLHSDYEITDTNEAGIVYACEEIPDSEGMMHLEISIPEPGAHTMMISDDYESLSECKLTYCKIQSIHLTDYDNFLYAAIFLALAALTWILGSFVPFEKYKMYLILAVAALVSSTPLLMDGLVDSFDMHIHLTRLNGIYNGLRNGEFPVYMNTIQMAGFGNPSAAMYPSFFLYPFALLKFFNVSLLTAYRVMLLCVNFATAYVSYYAFRKLLKNDKIGLVAAVLYTVSIYRLDNVYTRGALGESMAMIFLPLVLYGMYEVLWGEAKKFYVLAISVTGIILSHVLTTEMMIPFLLLEVVLWIVSLVRAKRAKELLPRVWGGVKAVVSVLLLTATFLVPFLTFFAEDLQCNHWEADISDSVVHLSQMFAVFPQYAGFQSGRVTTEQEMPLTIGGFLLVGVVLFFAWAKEEERKSLEYKIGFRCFIYGLLALLATSVFFPWALVKSVGILNTLFQAIQYIWRYLGLATVFMVVPSAIGIVKFTTEKSYKGLIVGLVMGLNLLSAFFYMDDMIHNMGQQYDKMSWEGRDDNDSLYMYYDGVGYRDFWYDYAKAVLYIEEETEMEVTDFARRATTVTAHIEAPELAGDETLVFPLNYMPGYKAWVNGTEVETFKRGEQVAINLTEPSADVKLTYKGLTAFVIANWISWIARLAGVAYFVVLRFRRSTPDSE